MVFGIIQKLGESAVVKTVDIEISHARKLTNDQKADILAHLVPVLQSADKLPPDRARGQFDALQQAKEQAKHHGLQSATYLKAALTANVFGLLVFGTQKSKERVLLAILAFIDEAGQAEVAPKI